MAQRTVVPRDADRVAKRLAEALPDCDVRIVGNRIGVKPPNGTWQGWRFSEARGFLRKNATAVLACSFCYADEKDYPRPFDPFPSDLCEPHFMEYAQKFVGKGA